VKWLRLTPAGFVADGALANVFRYQIKSDSTRIFVSSHQKDPYCYRFINNHAAKMSFQALSNMPFQEYPIIDAYCD